MADRPGFPDCNTCMMVDAQQRLWLFWPTVIGESWESCLMNYRVSKDYQEAGARRDGNARGSSCCGLIISATRHCSC